MTDFNNLSLYYIFVSTTSPYVISIVIFMQQPFHVLVEFNANDQGLISSSGNRFSANGVDTLSLKAQSIRNIENVPNNDQIESCDELLSDATLLHPSANLSVQCAIPAHPSPCMVRKCSPTIDMDNGKLNM